VWLLPVPLLAFGLLRLPYSYYAFLRLAVCAASGYVAWQSFRGGGMGRLVAVAFALLAIFYNPIFPARLTRETWAPINVLTACFFGAGALLVLRRLPINHKGGG
jgi:hypothetical protein